MGRQETMKRFKNKKVFITGGSSGIGKAAAILAARHGASVFIAARNQSRLDGALVEIRAAAQSTEQIFGSLSVDVTDAKAVPIAAARVLAELGGLDVLILNQGVGLTGHVKDVDEGDFERAMDINYFGYARFVKAFTPHFLKQGSGAICMVSSILGFMGVYGYSAYAASKHAIAGFARCLRADMKPYNVTVTLGYPPTTATPGLDRENETKPAESWAIEGKSKVYTAEQVARSLLRGTARGKFEVVTGAGSWFIWISMRLMPWLGHYIMDRELKKFRRKNQAERS